MEKLTLMLCMAILFQACSGECQKQKELEATKAELQQVKAKLDQLNTTGSKLLMHTVYLKTRPDLTEEEINDLKSKMQNLSSLPGVIGLELGVPAATGDPRLNSDYDFVLQMGFASEADLAAYQKNGLHVQARESAKAYLAAPPVVFDYWLN